MDLSREEEAILNGEEGEGRQKAMELVTALGKIYGAEDLIDITSAHLSGASYKTIGDGGLKYLEDMAAGGARVSVPSTLNPVGMDRERWREMHITEEFAEKQLRIIELYGRMGIRTTCSCTPYIGPNVPSLGDHVAWAESSALSFVNSFIGARTNREGVPGRSRRPYWARPPTTASTWMRTGSPLSSSMPTSTGPCSPTPCSARQWAWR